MALLLNFIDDFYENPGIYISHTDLMERRAIDLLNFAFTGYGMTFDEAIEKVQTSDITTWSQEQVDERNMLIKLIDNLVFFSVAEEHQVLLEMQNDRAAAKDQEEFTSMAISTFEKFNKRYALVEDGDVAHAMGLAALWMTFDNNQILEFKTQGDERVRDSHAALDGLRYRKNSFPEALTPPLDHGCRCYIINTGSEDGRTLTNKPNVDSLISDIGNTTFKKNVAVSGIMFSEDHPYFTIDENHVDTLDIVAGRIKKRIGAE